MKFIRLDLDFNSELDPNCYYWLTHPDFKDASEYLKVTHPRILGKRVKGRIEDLANLDKRWQGLNGIYIAEAPFFIEQSSGESN